MPVRVGLLTRLALAVSLALVITAPGQTQTTSTGEEVAGCASRDDCRPSLMGGLRIAFTGWACTSGFVARDPATPRWYLLTAGHCLADSGLLARWSHGSRHVGRGVMHAFRQGSNADVGAIEVSEGEASSHVFASGSDDILIVTGSSPNSAQTVGSPVCRSGATSGWTCGSIVAADEDVKIRGMLIRHTWWTDFPSATGDSGAPLVDPQGRVLGVLIATTPTRSVYSTVDWIASELGLWPCVPEACD